MCLEAKAAAACPAHDAAVAAAEGGVRTGRPALAVLTVDGAVDSGGEGLAADVGCGSEAAGSGAAREAGRCCRPGHSGDSATRRSTCTMHIDTSQVRSSRAWSLGHQGIRQVRTTLPKISRLNLCKNSSGVAGNAAVQRPAKAETRLQL